MRGAFSYHSITRRIVQTSIFLFVGLVISALFTSCGDVQSPVNLSETLNSASSSCVPALQALTPGTVVTYEEHVLPLIFRRVCSECHGAVAGLPNWLDYNQAFAKRDLIRYRVTNKIMPPATAKINSLTADEIALVQAWVDGGAPRGGASGGSPLPLAGCPPSTGNAGGGTVPVAPPVDLDPPPPAKPTFSADLKPKLFQPICGSCHGVLPDIPNWTIYYNAYKRADDIKRKVRDGEMPPPSSGIKLTDNQKLMIYRWVDQGAVY